MREIDRPEFLSAMRRLGTAFQRDVDEELLEVFWDGLLDLDIRDVRRGVEQSIRIENPHFPTPGQIRDRAGANNPAYHAPSSAPRMPDGRSFDNLPPDELARHVALLRKGVELMRSNKSSLGCLLPRAEAVLAEREAELGGPATDTDDFDTTGWEHG